MKIYYCYKEKRMVIIKARNKKEAASNSGISAKQWKEYPLFDLNQVAKEFALIEQPRWRIYEAPYR